MTMKFSSPLRLTAPSTSVPRHSYPNSTGGNDICELRCYNDVITVVIVRNNRDMLLKEHAIMMQ